MDRPNAQTGLHTRPMRRITAKGVWLILSAVALGLAGCEPEVHTAGPEMTGVPRGGVSVYQLAGQLGMSVAQSGRNLATLRNDLNCLTVYANPNGQAYLNGHPVGNPGTVVAAGGMLFVPAELEGVVKPLLIQPAPAPPEPDPLPVVVDEPAPPVYLGKVVLDPGHGGRDPGALGKLGLREKAINLSVAHMVADLLEKRGAKVILTRRNDQTVELEDRCYFSNKAGPDLFVSIHADWAQNSLAKGFTIYTARSCSRESREAASMIARHMAHAGVTSRGVRRANYRVLVGTKAPAVLVELGYMSNREEARLLAKVAYRRQLAAAIAEGIVAHLKSQR